MTTAVGRGLRRRWLWWAKSLPGWTIALIVLVVPLRLAPVLVDEWRHPHAGYWRVPAVADLRTVTGTLEEPLLQRFGRGSASLFWGKMTLDDGTLFWFTCTPGSDAPMCAYTVPANRDPNLGRRFVARYFDVASHRGSDHVLVSLRPAGCASCAAVVDEHDRLAALHRMYWLQFSPTFAEWLLLAIVIGFAPGIAFRLATGKGSGALAPPRAP